MTGLQTRAWQQGRRRKQRALLSVVSVTFCSNRLAYAIGIINRYLDACLNPLTDSHVARSIRTQQLEVVIEILSRHNRQEPLSAIELHLFWTLYTGVLAFWANDKSPHQEDTLAMLDQSMKMFVNWIDQNSNADNGN